MDLKKASYTEKNEDSDKKYIREEVTSVNVEEIENGFLIIKDCKLYYKIDKKYNSKGEDYDYKMKKYYSKTNPLTIRLDNKSLADIFDED